MHCPGAYTPYWTIRNRLLISYIVVSSAVAKLWSGILAHSVGHQLLTARVVSPDDMHCKYHRRCKKGAIGGTHTQDGG